MFDFHTNVNIYDTINSGQIFLWENYKNTWFIVNGHDIIVANQNQFENTTLTKETKKFFNLDAKNWSKKSDLYKNKVKFLVCFRNFGF